MAVSLINSIQQSRPKLLAIAITAAIIVLAVCVLIGVIHSASNHGGEVLTKNTEPNAAAEQDFSITQQEPQIFVHVLGAVKTPGVYQLSADSRVIDAITAAGGASEEAELASVNLARTLSDGEQLIVLRVGEDPPANSAGGSGTGGAGSPAKINLNQADSQQLQELPGVGPATAERIINWRQSNGNFASVDELIAVPGIGPKTLAEIREHATV